MREYTADRNISLGLAEKVIDAVVKKAEEIKVPMAIAVVDASGILKAFKRMDGVHLWSVEIAQNKAWSAAVSHMATDKLYEFIAKDPPLLTGLVHLPKLTVFGGGFPIMLNGSLIGGLGVSGGHYTQDMECAKAGLEVVAELEGNKK